MAAACQGAAAGARRRAGAVDRFQGRDRRRIRGPPGGIQRARSRVRGQRRRTCGADRAAAGAIPRKSADAAPHAGRDRRRMAALRAGAARPRSRARSRVPRRARGAAAVAGRRARSATGRPSAMRSMPSWRCALARERAGSAAAIAAGASATPRRGRRALPALPAPFEEALRRRAGLVSGGRCTDRRRRSTSCCCRSRPRGTCRRRRLSKSARRERKLLAMKAALEGRRPGAAESTNPDEALARLLGRSDLDAGQRERLEAALARWRRDGAKGSLRA